MPTSTRKILLARYHYDPLDRLVDCTPSEQSAIQRYYCKTRLSTELQGTVQRTIVQHDEHLLAQQQRESDKTTTTLLAADQQRSVLSALDANQTHALAYAPYGHRPAEKKLQSLLGFTGERPDPVTGHYHLGNGYRQFNPVLMRFNSPDSWSPFGKGWINAYAYCGGDPITRRDTSGHFITSALLWGGVGLLTAGGITLITGAVIDDRTTQIVGGTAAVVGALSIMAAFPVGLYEGVNRLRQRTLFNVSGSAAPQPNGFLYPPATPARRFSTAAQPHQGPPVLAQPRRRFNVLPQHDLPPSYNEIMALDPPEYSNLRHNQAPMEMTVSPDHSINPFDRSQQRNRLMRQSSRRSTDNSVAGIGTSIRNGRN